MKVDVWKKCIAIMLVMVLTMANLMLVGTEVYAAYEQLENQGVASNNQNVEYDAYFSENGGKKHSIEQQIGNTAILNMYVGIKNSGYLKEASIHIDNPNFKIANAQTNQEIIKSVDVNNNQINLNQVNAGQDLQLQLPIVFEKQSDIDLSYFGKEVKTDLTGIYTDANGKEKKVKKEIIIRLDWKADAVATVSQQIQTYKTINKAGQNKIMLQTAIQTGIVDNVLPQQENTTTIKVPIMNGLQPEEVKVYGIHTSANYEYNKNSGEITIKQQNSANDNKVIWENRLKEYKIVYLYPENAKKEQSMINLKATTSIKAYNKQEQLTAVEEKTETLTEEQGSILVNKIGTTQELNKGNLYANSNYETEYETKWMLEILDHDLFDGMTVTSDNDKFIKEDGNKTESATFYKSTKISKENFETILGNEGTITIYNITGQEIGTINSQTQADENGNLVINYNGQDTNAIKVVTSNPQTEGVLEVINTKAIKAQTGYSMQELRTFRQIETTSIVNGQKEQQNVSEEIAKNNITLKETITKAEVSISNQNLSTVVKNENVELRATLQSDNSQYDLYQNPSLQIELPSEVTEVAIKSVDLLFTDELKVAGHEVITNANGNKVVNVALEGNQTQYATTMNKGIQLVINTDLTLNQLATSANKQIVMHYNNAKALQIDNGGVATADVTIAAPTGLVTLNSIANYSEQKAEVTSLSGKEQTAELEIQSNDKIATMKLTVINNNQNSINNPKILGRVPFVGNKKITGEELGSNMDTILKAAIRAEGIDASQYVVYYSENGTATEDLNDTNNGWTKDVSDFSKIKSYLIVTNNYEMPQASNIAFLYDIEIPGGLNHNMSAYGTYAVYYDNMQDGQVMKLRAVAPTVGMTTGEGPVLETTLANDAGGQSAPNKVITYRVEVKNTGSKTAEAAKAIINIPDGADYAEFKPGDGDYEPDQYISNPEMRSIQVEIGDIPAGQTITKQFHLKPNKTGEIEVKASVSANNVGTIETNSIKDKIVNLQLDVDLNCATPTTVLGEEEVQFYGLIGNISQNTINNVKATIKVDENYDYIRAFYLADDGQKLTNQIKYDDKTRTITYNVGTIEVGKYKNIRIILETKKLNNNVASATASTMMEVTADGIALHKSKEYTTTITRADLEVTTKTSIPEGYVKPGDKLDYIITVKNIGPQRVKDIKIGLNISDKLKYLNTSYKVGEIEDSGYIFENGRTEIEASINPGETLTMIVETTVKEVTTPDEGGGSIPDEDVNTKVEVDVPGEDKKEEDINHKVDDPNGPDANGKYRISGTAWLDENRDGTRQDEETILSGITVTLMNAQTGKPAQNENGDNITAVTGDNGQYTLSGIDKGNYFVLFDYDTKQYGLTEYQKEGVPENKNSDVITTTVEGDSPRQAAITNTINIETKSMANVDIGFILTPAFDLSLDKTVNKITMQNNKKTTTKEFNDEKLAKIDVDGKQISNTNLIIEYKIKVTNEGTVDGYAKKIIDYMPKELKFSSELNKDWYTTNSGDLMNASLANEIIKPGETKELTLVLTKKMTESGNGIVNNTAEIAESYNDYGLADIDSVAGNRQDGEDDMSSADVIIGLKTGRAIMYITLTATLMIAIGAGAYLVNKKVLKI